MTSDSYKPACATLAEALHFIAHHGENEDALLLPLLRERAPLVFRAMTDAHTGLDAARGALAAAPPGPELYLAVCDFTARYLGHMHDEETTDSTTAASFQNADASGTPYNLAISALPASASRGSDLGITYSPAGLQDAIDYSIQGSCIDGVVNQVSGDPGTITIAKGSLVQAKDAVTNCQVTGAINRARTGTLDPAFSGGSIQGKQPRQVTVTSTP